MTSKTAIKSTIRDRATEAFVKALGCRPSEVNFHKSRRKRIIKINAMDGGVRIGLTWSYDKAGRLRRLEA